MAALRLEWGGLQVGEMPERRLAPLTAEGRGGGGGGGDFGSTCVGGIYEEIRGNWGYDYEEFYGTNHRTEEPLKKPINGKFH